MGSNWIYRINSTIKYSFYLLFFVTPLVMWPTTYELFEFNKMWLVFMLTIFIAFLWIAKSIILGKIEIRKTPLDIPILLFLTSQIISTIISIEPHVSLWGYYSRFNGGLFSTIAYIILYYAFASNLISEGVTEKKPISYSLLTISLISGLIVTLWGIPSHFGYDPTCFAFRGTFDVSCWTEAFQPKIRIFSTLGQPNWLGTYLAVLIPIALGFGFFRLKESESKISAISYLLMAVLFYIALLWTKSQSSFLGLGLGLLLFFGVLIFQNYEKIRKRLLAFELSRHIVLIILIFGGITFFIGTPIESVNKFTTLSGLTDLYSKPLAGLGQPKSEGFSSSTNIDLGGTESSKIRLIVWEGAIELFKKYPLFGTGVETYAYAYYNVKPLSHNLTSEWDFLYNKAHNEYLNFLATTGIAGLTSYLFLIGYFLYDAIRKILKSKLSISPILLGITSGFIAMLVSNFFGFSVVILSLFLFVFPLLFFDLTQNKALSSFRGISLGKIDTETITPIRTTLIIAAALIALSLELYLFNFWRADNKYALGYNLNKGGEYVDAYTNLSEASRMLSGEDLYKDELSINMATLAFLLSDQKEATQASQFAQNSLELSDELFKKHPKNVVFLKTRARVFYALGQINPAYLDLAISTIETTRKLAPTDAKLVYNLAIFYNQKGDTKKAIQYFDEALKLKPNYLDAHYTRALFYSEQAKTDFETSINYKQKAKQSLEYILNNIDPRHEASKELLKTL